MDMYKNFNYFGDVNLVHGGTILPHDLKDQYEYGFIDAVTVGEIYDLGNEVLLIQKITIIVPENEEEENEVLSGLGVTVDDLPSNEEERRSMIINACVSHGKYDSMDHTYLATNYDEDYSELSDIVTDEIAGESNEEIVEWMKDNGWL